MKKQLLNQKRLTQLLSSLVLFLLCMNVGWGQNPPSATDVATDGDFRTLTSGNWSDNTTWQVRSGGVWANAGVGVYPGATNTVYIQVNHKVTLTAEASCYSLHIATIATSSSSSTQSQMGILALGANNLNIYGKIRGYKLTPSTALTGSTDSNYFGTDVYDTSILSTVVLASGMSSSSGGLMKFVGTSRTMSFLLEWKAQGVIPKGEFAFSPTAVVTSECALKFNPFTITSGALIAKDALSANTGGAFLIKSGAVVSSSVSGSTTGVVGNSSSAATGTVTIENGGTLELTGVTPSICTLVFTNNGTVVYNGGALQTMLDRSNSAGIDATLLNGNYNNLTIGSGTTISIPTTVPAVAVSGELTVDGTLNTNNKITLKSTASKTAVVAPVVGTISGNVTTERYIPSGHRAYRLLSPATTGGTIKTNWQENQADGANVNVGYGTHITGAGGSINGFDTTTSNQASVFTHNNTNPAWTALANTSETLTAGNPYLVYVRGSRQASNISSTSNDATTLRTTGILKTGDVVVSGLNAMANGFSVVGNPYQAQVDMQAVLASATNLNTAYYYVVDPSMGSKGGYLTVDVTDAATSHISKYLQAGQACFVNTLTDAPASLTFTEANKSTEEAQTSIFKTRNATTPSLNITLLDAAANRLDVLKVAFDASESNAVNQNDAIKLGNFDESMATSNGGVLLAIEKRALPTATDVIPLNITKYRGTSYTLKVQGSGLTETPYLVDNFTNTTTEIPVNGTLDYAYTVDAANAATTDASRFKLIYAKTLGTNTNTIAGFALYPNPSKSNSFNVVVPQSSSKASITVSNLLGQKIFSQTDLNSGATAITVSNAKAAGIYLVSLNLDGKTATTKWIVE